MEIKILGTGCPKCKSLEKMTTDTVAELNLEASVSKEEDIMKIMAYGVLSTPALVVDDKVLISGRLPSKKEITDLLTQK
jgi:small redox-active disulfide protein 2